MRRTVLGLVVCAGWALAPGLAAAQDTVVVGVTTTGVPFTYVDTATQKTTGAMVDLAEAIVTDIGATPRFDLTAFSALIPGLVARKINLISAGMLVTEKRREVVAFSDPVYAYGEAMFVAGETKDLKLEELKGEVVGAQVGTAFVAPLQNTGLFKEVKLYDSIADIMRDVKLGRLKAGFGDAPIVRFQVARNPTLGVRLVESYRALTTGEVALAMSKDDPAMLAKVNAAIAKLKGDGKLRAIFAKYGL